MMDVDEIKRKLRQLKQMEIRIRYGGMPKDGPLTAKSLLWNWYFSDKTDGCRQCKYPIYQITAMDHEERKEIFSDYLYAVYFQMFRETGMVMEGIFDPAQLTLFGLQPGAGINEIKARFRYLAKKYHPDTGGSNEKMMELLEQYHRLLDNTPDA